MPLEEKNALMNMLLGKHSDAAPEIEIVKDPFALDVDLIQAIRIIQKNDRGRQGRQRVMLILKNIQ